MWNDQIQDFVENLPYLNAAPTNLVPGYFGHIVQVERIGIIAK